MTTRISEDGSGKKRIFFNDKSKLGNLLNECPDKTLIEGIDQKRQNTTTSQKISTLTN